MGIISFIKGGVQELAIARPDAAKDFWVYKHPDQTIPMKAQLTVDSDEVCLFFKDGKYVGTFAAGRHTMDTQNIPFLDQLIDKFTGGNVFIAEAYFVNMREMPSIKFGTTVGDVQDPQTQLRVRLMVHGEFSAKVIDPVKFVIGLVGQRATSNDGFLSWFKSQINKTMKDQVAQQIVKQKLPVMQVTSGAISDLEKAVMPEVREDIEPYGVEIVRFGDFQVSMDDADKDRLDKLVDRMAYVNGMGSVNGGMAAYQQLAQAEIMMGTAEGLKTGGAGVAANAFQGAGIGMGFAMANNMAGMMGGGQNQPGQVPKPATESKEQLMATLKQLGELKSAGILTDAEFDQKKKEILAKL